MTQAVEVREAFRIYQSGSGSVVALQGLTLDVKSGEIVAVLGPSGSGKTTLLRTIAGFEQLSAGSVQVFGSQIGHLSSRETARFRAANLGFLDQHYAHALSPDISCRDTVALQLGLLGCKLRESRRIADELLERVGLSERRHERPNTLSGGEQQRVALCAAIAHRPRIVLADEPVGELDAENAALIYQLVEEMARETGATALIVSHDPGAAAIADRLVHIRDGRVVEQAVRGQSSALVVSGGGWIRIPVRHMRELGIPSLVVAERRAEGLVLRSAENRALLKTPVFDVVRGISSTAASKQATGRTPVGALRRLGKSYRVAQGERVVLTGIDLEIYGGRLHAVVGRSGSGKTTLLHLLAGLQLPTAGDVTLLGEQLRGKDRSQRAALRRRYVAVVTQEPGLVPYLSPSENVALALRLRGEKSALAQRAGSALGQVGLSERLNQRTASLSAGERQRVAIARALAVQPRLILADEPTARLDQENSRLVGELLLRAARNSGIAVVCATHDPVLIELADEVFQLDQGADESVA